MSRLYIDVCQQNILSANEIVASQVFAASEIIFAGILRQKYCNSHVLLVELQRATMEQSSPFVKNREN